VSAKEGPIVFVLGASVLLAFYLPAEPYKAQALALLGGRCCGLGEAGGLYFSLL